MQWEPTRVASAPATFTPRRSFLGGVPGEVNGLCAHSLPCREKGQDRERNTRCVYHVAALSASPVYTESNPNGRRVADPRRLGGLYFYDAMPIGLCTTSRIRAGSTTTSTSPVATS